MATNLNDSTPAAATGRVNATWQKDGSGNVSASVQFDPAINTQTVSYVAVLSDDQNVVVMNVAGANTFTVPTNASVAFPVGAVLTVVQYGAGQTTLTPASGAVTLHTPSSLTTKAQYATVTLTQVSANTWVAGGLLT